MLSARTIGLTASTFELANVDYADVDLTVAGVIDTPPRRVSTANH